ncbi:MAG: MFS transporter [Dysgonomonas sp.]|jgi:dipeptide/tripeptide permease|uniref:MFS transporter n=1 Tax=unclassified Dysgonomonas TaxID=2630389 RepID=UPI0025BDF5E0|nr:MULTISPECIES: MFS transporter [unclassified Dysgonomonas]MDR1715091.1 MFS transporter [Prevotella sp.]MDR2004193.1 MFS transporter [Prevotella sp.]HMM04923.1 MFS transporter [Dysgonomonas sp.]
MTKFSRAFWVANSVELLERLAYYAVFIVITLYLSNVWGFSDIEAGIISGIFSAMLYFLPTFAGAYADKIGFRSSIILAFALLTVGYGGLGLLPTLLESAGLVSYGMTATFTGLETSYLRWSIAPILVLIVIGGAFIKAVISGTVARETTSENRARGYAIFYMMVNIGAFTGKTVVDPLRRSMGDEGLVYLNFFSASMTLLALIAVFFFYKSVKTEGKGKSFAEIGKALWKVCQNGRLIALILIISGFWMIQSQMYATMPKYVIRMIGEGASPGWYANVNPLVVFVCVNFVTSFMKRRTALTSMTIGMLIIPFSALVMSFGNQIGTDYVMGLHPVAFMMIVGIAMQALAECFISPRFLEYFSLQSPKGEEGLYLGFSHLHSFFSYLFAFGLSGFLLEKYCPDPKAFASQVEYAAATVNAHYIWYVFVGIGMVSAIALVIYGRVVKNLDRKKLNPETE